MTDKPIHLICEDFIFQFPVNTVTSLTMIGFHLIDTGVLEDPLDWDKKSYAQKGYRTSIREQVSKINYYIEHKEIWSSDCKEMFQVVYVGKNEWAVMPYQKAFAMQTKKFFNKQPMYLQRKIENLLYMKKMGERKDSEGNELLYTLYGNCLTFSKCMVATASSVLSMFNSLGEQIERISKE